MFNYLDYNCGIINVSLISKTLKRTTVEILDPLLNASLTELFIYLSALGAVAMSLWAFIAYKNKQQKDFDNYGAGRVGTTSCGAFTYLDINDESSVVSQAKIT